MLTIPPQDTLQTFVCGQCPVWYDDDNGRHGINQQLLK